MADSRQLRYFVAVAEELSFSRAAERLHLSQPALSEAIRRLEIELGIRLLERTSRRVELTAAGRTLLEESRVVLARLDEAIQRTRRTASGQAGRLRVGFQGSGAGEIATAVGARFAERYPDVSLEPKRFGWGEEAKGLHERACDVAFVWLPADTTGLRTEPVATEARYLAVPAGHALADRAEVGIMDVCDEPLLWTRRAPRYWVDWWAVNPRPDGSAPRWGPENDNLEEMLEQVAQGLGICFVPESMTRFYARPDLRWVPMTDVEPLRIVLAWPTDSRCPLVERFVEVTREVAAGRVPNA